jgi:hypothetical protein
VTAVGSSRTVVAGGRLESLLSYRRLMQAGSVAAAIGSIVGLAFTVGDRVAAPFRDEERTGVHLEQVAVTEAIPLRDYFATRENRTDVDDLGFSNDELARDVRVVDYDARFEGGTKGEAFLFDRTLQRRGADGRITIVGRQSESQTLDAADDSCGCFDYFFLTGRGAEYRVVVEVKRPNAPNADPIQRRESDWFRA